MKAAGHFGNTTPESNRNVQYVIVSPKGTHPDGFNTNTGFCAWHGYNGNGWVNAPSAYGDVAFTNLPYIPDMGKSCGANFVNAGAGGLLDGVTMVEGHEFSETITDQNPGGGWYDSDGEENADKCAWLHVGQVGAAQNVSFATGTFAMQSTWSNDGQLCSNSHAIWGVAGLPDSYVDRHRTPLRLRNAGRDRLDDRARHDGDREPAECDALCHWRAARRDADALIVDDVDRRQRHDVDRDGGDDTDRPIHHHCDRHRRADAHRDLFPHCLRHDPHAAERRGGDEFERRAVQPTLLPNRRPHRHVNRRLLDRRRHG